MCPYSFISFIVIISYYLVTRLASHRYKHFPLAALMKTAFNFTLPWVILAADGLLLTGDRLL